MTNESKTNNNKEMAQQQKQSTLDDRSQVATYAATMSGLSAGIKVALVSIPTVLLLSRFHPGFRNKIRSYSARTGLAISPPILVYAFYSEQAASRLANPAAFGENSTEVYDHRLSIPKQIGNFVYENPFKTIVLTGLPVVTAIFLSRDHHLKFSQRVMHTRVMGQASILLIVAGVLGFRQYMDERGKFAVDDK